MSKYPLTGFSKISWEEFCGMLEILQLYKSLGSEQKDIIDLMMLGMQKREEVKRAEGGKFTTDGFYTFTEIRRDPEAGKKLDESYKKGDIVKVIANDEYFGILCKIYEKCVDSTRKDLYAVVPISGEINLGQKIYAGCSLQLVAKGE